MEHFASKVQNQTRSLWHSPELQNFIIDAVQNIQSPLCIFIDALDEGQENDIRQMINFLENLAGYAGYSNATVRICLSSRHYPHITIKDGLSLEVEHQSEHSADIAFYIENKLKVDEYEHMSALCEVLNTKSAGIFLWVILVIELLNQIYDRGEGFDAMAKCLRRVPETLKGVFTEILCRSSEDVRTCLSLFRWVLLSTRPLSPAEIHSAIEHDGLPASVENCRYLQTPNKGSLYRYILNHSRGLVEVT